MTYPIIPELYGIVARKLLDEIGEKSFYSGSFSFDYGSKECRFVASIVVYRSKVCLPEGDADRIDDLVPVWWEFHTSDQAGERPNDFSFSELKEYLFWFDSARPHIPSGAAPPAVFFRTHCSWFSIPAATGGSVFPLSFEKLNAVLRLSDAAILESGRPVRIETLRLPSAAPCHRAELKNYWPMNIDVLKDLSPAEPASAGDLPPFGLFAAGVYPFLEFRWFHEAYYRVLEAFAAGRVRRLIVTMPPQHGKSVGASTLLPAYLLGRNPDLRIAIASYSASLASKFNRRVQRIIDSPEYAAFFPETTIKRGARPPEYLRTADEVEIIGHRGGLLSVGREGALTGNRVDCFILDDLYRK